MILFNQLLDFLTLHPIETLLAFSVTASLPFFSYFIYRKYIPAYNLYKSYRKPKVFDYELISIGADGAPFITKYMKENPNAKVVVVKNTKGIQKKSQFSPNDLALSRIDFVSGDAQIISPYEISVNGKIFAARNLLIATGAAANTPEFEGVSDVSSFTLDSLWQLNEVPSRLLIIGENSSACNLAQTYSERGSKVTLVTSEKRLLQDEEETVSEYMLSSLNQQDVNVAHHAFLQRFEKTKNISLAFFDHDGSDLVVEFDVVIFALGEVPNTTRIGLEKLEIPLNPDGTIQVDSSLRTNYPTIFACGKVARYLD